jgi:5-carboxymethyl-2-hydroxymuconate isomerase
MSHFVLEYTDNISAEARIPELLRRVNQVMLTQAGVFPPGGIRSRAVELHDYCVAEGDHNDAFVHATLKIGFGRSEAVKKKLCDELFDAIKEHFADIFARRPLALSMEFAEFSEAGTYKHNNIHSRYRKS